MIYVLKQASWAMDIHHLAKLCNRLHFLESLVRFEVLRFLIQMLWLASKYYKKLRVYKKCIQVRE